MFKKPIFVYDNDSKNIIWKEGDGITNCHWFHQPKKLIYSGLYYIGATGGFYGYYDGELLHYDFWDQHHETWNPVKNEFISVEHPKFNITYEEIKWTKL